jgi:hypothetical protein
MAGDKSMSKQDELVLDILTICNRHGIESYQAVQVFAYQDLLREVVQELETAEAASPIILNEVQ